MTKKRAVGRYPKSFRKMAVERLKSCDNIVALSEELGVHRRLLYKWRDQLEPIEDGEGPPANSRERELRQQVSQLKRLVADKTLEADFFKGALQKIEARRQSKGSSGETASTNRKPVERISIDGIGILVLRNLRAHLRCAVVGSAYYHVLLHGRDWQHNPHLLRHSSSDLDGSLDFLKSRLCHIDRVVTRTDLRKLKLPELSVTPCVTIEPSGAAMVTFAPTITAPLMS